MTKIDFCGFNAIIEAIKKIETDTILFVVDHQVLSQYKDVFPLLETDYGKKVIVWRAPNGEKVKNFEEYQKCCEFFLEKGIHRNSHLVVCGGGALSDFGGFVASTLLRGINWSIIPTTLLSMIDASIGGKTGINTKSGKNLVGTFHHPQNVWINSEFVHTLPEREMKSSMGEMIKYAFLSEDIHKRCLETFNLNEIIKVAANYKYEITNDDFKEKGNRKILNLGHTFGHALEYIYNLSHGESVYWGMVMIFFLYDRSDLLAEMVKIRDIFLIEKKDAPWLNKEIPIDRIMELIEKDKKASGKDSIELIVIEEIGQPTIAKKTFSDCRKLLESHANELKKFTL
jgi:3-dehydroquinate synthase